MLFSHHMFSRQCKKEEGILASPECPCTDASARMDNTGCGAAGVVGKRRGDDIVT
jgi:hypothetical protein